MSEQIKVGLVEVDDGWCVAVRRLDSSEVFGTEPFPTREQAEAHMNAFVKSLRADGAFDSNHQ